MAKDDSDSLNRSSCVSKDVDSNESFMKKVSSRVSDLIPSSLSKWFARDEDNKSTVRYREDDEDSYLVQPPTKRVKIPMESSFSYNNFSLSSTETPTHHNNVPPKRRVDNLAQTLNFAEPVAGPSGIKARKLSISKTPQPCTSKEMLNGEKDTDSGDSTSGYSSMVKIGSKEQLTEKIDAAKPKEAKANPLFYSTPIKENNRRTLFRERSLTPQTNSSLSSRRPSFNASPFGSPTFVDRTLSTQRILNSPFYNGRTVYGGASAYGRKLGTTTELKSPLRNSVQVKPINEKSMTQSNSSLSRTAQKILDTLEQYTTPVTDAKKIPPPTRRCDALLSKYTGVNPYANRTAPNRGLQVPTIPDLLKLKGQLQESTVSVRQMATTSKSELNRKEYKIAVEDKELAKHSNKMKSKVSSLRQKSSVSLEERGEQVKLPNVALPITTLPKFDFSLPAPPAFTKAQTDAPKAGNVVSACKVTAERKETDSKRQEYQFSDPLVIAENIKSIISINNFKFSEPILKKNAKNSATINFKTPDANAEIKLKRVAPRNNGEIQPAPALSSGSVMDVLGKQRDPPSLLDKFRPQEGSWECSVCLIRNQADSSKCAACEAPKVRPEPKDDKPKVANFGAQFKLSADMWECSSCMVRNSKKDDKCVACQTPNRAKSDAPSVNNVLSFKPPQNTWECDTCMIRNSDAAEQCAACESLKPGLRKMTKTVGFGDIFKKKSDEWECGSCMVKNPNDKLKCQCCETAKPGVTVAIDKASSFPKFSFGIDKATASSFTFGIKPVTSQATPADTKTEVKPAFTEVKPSFTEVKPAFTEVKPSFTEVKPAFTEVKPAFTEVKPAFTEVKPAFTEVKPAFTEAKPAFTAIKPAFAEVKPAFTEVKPSFTEAKPSFTGNKPAFSEVKPSFTEAKPAFTGVKAAFTEVKPSFTEAKPAFTGINPAFTEIKPVSTEVKPAFTMVPAVSASSIFGAAAKAPPTTSAPAFVFGFKPTIQKTETTKPENNLEKLGKPEPAPAQVKDNENPLQKAAFPAAPMTFSFGASASAPSTSADQNRTSIGGSLETKTESALKPAQSSIFAFKDEKKSVSAPSFLFGGMNNAPKIESPMFSAKPDLLQSKPFESTVNMQQPIAFGAKPASALAQNHFPDVNKSTPTVFAFSATNNNKIEEKPSLFNTTSNVASASGTTFPVFGNSAPIQFGASSSAKINFGTPTTVAQPEVKPFSFGAVQNEQPAVKPAPAVFAFGQKAPEPAPQPQSMFGNTSAPTTNFGMGNMQQQQQNPIGGFSFGATKPQQTPFAFSSPAAPPVVAPVAGSSAAVPVQNGGFNFGAAANANAIKPGFGFGSATNVVSQPAVPGVFNFGSANAQPSPSGGYNFGPPQFSDSVKPMFNFTGSGGGIPATFSAQPSSEGAQPQRKLRRAHRRANR